MRKLLLVCSLALSSLFMYSVSADNLVLPGYTVDSFQPVVTSVERMPEGAFVIEAHSDTGIDTDHFMLVATVANERTNLYGQSFSGVALMSVMNVDEAFTVGDRSLSKRLYDS